MVADTKPLVPPALVLGVLVFFGGALFLADNLGVLGAQSGWAMWPVAVILLGVVVALQPGADSREIGLVLLIAGVWLLFNAVGIWSYAFWDAWPPILILLGAWMLARTAQLRRRAGGADGYDGQDTGAERVGAFAFVSQVHRRTTGQRLRSGEMTAIAGDCSFDFTDAARGAEPIVVDVLVIAGRVRITVPEGWSVEMRVLPVVGKVVDGRGDDGGAGGGVGSNGAATGGDGAASGGDGAGAVDVRVQGTVIVGRVEVVGVE